jgi:adenine deaminase
MRFTLRDAHLIDATTDIACGAITLDGTYVQAVECPEYSDDQQDVIIDATGMLLVPGFIDANDGFRRNASLCSLGT